MIFLYVESEGKKINKVILIEIESRMVVPRSWGGSGGNGKMLVKGKPISYKINKFWGSNG